MTIEFTEQEMEELFALVADEVLQDRILHGLSVTPADQKEIVAEVYQIIFKIFDGLKTALKPETIIANII